GEYLAPLQGFANDGFMHSRGLRHLARNCRACSAEEKRHRDMSPAHALQPTTWAKVASPGRQTQWRYVKNRVAPTRRLSCPRMRASIVIARGLTSSLLRGPAFAGMTDWPFGALCGFSLLNLMPLGRKT